ncbi:hypothetical protein DCAR_0832939 [Daucus carota subsp. sativus]|uniref:Uncharacterized protein n=1 Tax=Daucus carota subsp. sativus TaxID=79200 RepID=A0A175YRM0_DAUCS|nr:hypothetical protein DCAR_0832939 [Daucus carota subsp. sativus]
MEHFIIITTIICIASSSFFTPCDSLSAAGYDHQLTRRTVLPRKLGLSEDHEEAKKKQASIETWREWVEEGSDSSQYFTMDYSRVRRRRPIHNKSLPVAP